MMVRYGIPVPPSRSPGHGHLQAEDILHITYSGLDNLERLLAKVRTDKQILNLLHLNFCPFCYANFQDPCRKEQNPSTSTIENLDVDGFLTVGTAHKMLLRLTLSTCHYLSDLGLVWSSGCILIL